jgi:hypothetical protein
LVGIISGIDGDGGGVEEVEDWFKVGEIDDTQRSIEVMFNSAITGNGSWGVVDRTGDLTGFRRLEETQRIASCASVPGDMSGLEAFGSGIGDGE